jgi:hypothetical protein
MLCNRTYLSRGIGEVMVKIASLKGMMKLKTVVSIVALLLSVAITVAGSSQIIIENADTTWNATSEYSAELIDATDNVTSRVTVEDANIIYYSVLIILADLYNTTARAATRITTEYANTIYTKDLNEVPATFTNLTKQISGRLIFEYANSNYCKELIFPKELINDILPPVITDISVINLTNNSATITWRTDEFADSTVKYGENSTAYTETCIDVLFVKEHEITLTGLLPDTTYYFLVNSTDQSGNSAESSEYSFKYEW